MDVGLWGGSMLGPRKSMPEKPLKISMIDAQQNSLESGLSIKGGIPA